MGNVLGIIGTAGRGNDAEKIDLTLFNKMKIAAFGSCDSFYTREIKKIEDVIEILREQ